MPLSLSGLRVVEIGGGLPLSVATFLLAELGADVLKIQAPGEEIPAADPGWLVWGRGKRTLELNLERAEDRAEAQRQVSGADMALVYGPPGTEERLGLAWESLHAAQPGLILVSLTPWGEQGPLRNRPASEPLIAARSGMVGDQPGFRPGPSYQALPLASYGAGLVMAQSLLAALHVRHRTGEGQRITTSWFAGALSMQTATLVVAEGMARTPGGDPRGSTPVYRLYPCKDGRWLMLGCINAGFWYKIAVALGIPEAISDPRWVDSPMGIRDPDARAALSALVEAKLSQRTQAEWLDFFDHEDVPAAPVNTIEEYMADPQVRHTGLLVERQHPEIGRLWQMDRPFMVRGVASEGLRAGMTPLEAASSQRAAPPMQHHAGPLAGLRVLDLSSYIAGALCPTLLAEMGAEVIKLESKDGDPLRSIAGGFLAWNLGKRGMVADLRTEEGRAIGHALAAQADIVVENMRPGATKRLQMDYETLRGLNPRLIYCTVTAYGSDGPYAHKPGVDPLLQARSGTMAAQGGLAGKPVFMRVAVNDYAGAMLATSAILAALHVRDISGEGQRVETSLLRAGAFLNADAFQQYEGKPPRYVNDVDHVGPHALSRLYQAADGWVFIHAVTDEHWRALCRALGRDDWEIDPRFAKAADRPAYTYELAGAIRRILRPLSAERIETMLVEAGVPATVVPEVYGNLFFTDEQALANHLTVPIAHPAWPGLHQSWLTPKFSATPAGPPRAAPVLGQHTAEILAELGYTAAQIEDLRARGIVNSG